MSKNTIQMTLFIISMMPSTQALSFFDDDAHNQLRLVRERMSSLEATSKRQADTNEQQGREIVDLREQVEAEKSKFKALLSQNETLNNVLSSTQQIIESRYTEHRTYIQNLEKRSALLEVCSKQQTVLVNSLQASSQASSSQMDQAIQQQIKSMVSLQGTTDNQSAELRRVKGLNEDLTNKLQSLDAHMRRLEADILKLEMSSSRSR